MPNDEIARRIKSLEDELADLKAVHGAEGALREDAQAHGARGLARLRSVKRKEGYQHLGGDDE